MIVYPGSLHNHTDMSNQRLRDSINRLDELIDYAIELGHEVIAFTEHETISNAIKIEKYYQKVKETHPNFKVIRGNEIYLCRDGLSAENFVQGIDKYYHFILLAKDAIGHQQIRELSTRAWSRSWMNGKMRRVPTYYQDLRDIIQTNPGHVIGSTACLGGYLDNIILKWYSKAASYESICDWCRDIKEIFGEGNFFLEMQPSTTPEQVIVNQTISKLSNDLDIPYIITTDSHYCRKEDAPIHKAFLNAQEGEREVDSFYATTYMMDTKELESFFPYFTSDVLEVAYRNILQIKDACKDYSLLKPLKIPSLQWRQPKIQNISVEWIERIPYLQTFADSDFNGDNILARLIIDKLVSDKRLQNQETYDEINDNLKITWISSNVNKTHWSAYFLNLQKTIDVCWDAGTLIHCGRGCFAPNMKITLANGQAKNISEVVVGDEVFTHTGEIHKVKQTFVYDVNESLYNIKIAGTENIICTNNHKILGIHNIPCKYGYNCTLSCTRPCGRQKQLKPTWIEAQNLRINDMVAIPRYKYPTKKLQYIDLAQYHDIIKYCTWDDNFIYTYRGNNTIHVANKYQRFIPIDKEFLYFLGIFIGDGWAKKEDQSIGLCFHSENEKDQISQQRIEKYLTSLNLSYYIKYNQNGKKVNQVLFSNPFLGYFLNQNCGHGAENKHIPSQFLYDNYDEMETLLYGLLNSDGNISSKENRISYDTINFNLANQVRNLLSFLGIYASIHARMPQDTREEFKNSKISYKVRASGKQLRQFSFFNFQGTRNTVQRDNNYFYPRVETITTSSYEGKVYDLSVEKDTSYVVNNIAVHNSGVGFLLLYILEITQINPLWEKTRTYSWRLTLWV